MNNLDIRIDIKPLYYSEVFDKNEKRKIKLLVLQEYAEYIRWLYLSMLREEIFSPRYKGYWEPIEEEGYQEYLGIDKFKYNIYDLIDNALIIDKKGYYYYIKIDDTYLYPDTSIRLERVVRAIDSGTRDFKARPIFRKVVIPLQRDVDNRKLWRGFLKKRGMM